MSNLLKPDMKSLLWLAAGFILPMVINKVKG